MHHASDSLISIKSALLKGQVVYQDDSDQRHPQRWKPYLLTPAGILYQGIAIKINQRDFKVCGFTNTPYGVFTRKPLVSQVPWSWLPSASGIFFGTRHTIDELESIDPAIIYAPSALAVLGLSYPFTQEELKEGYRKLVKQHHPDAGGNADRFMEIQAAYELLKED